MRRLTFTSLFVLAAITLRADQVQVLKSRISDLAAQLPPVSAIEMLLRAAVLLAPSDPAASQKFSAQGIDLLRNHPEVRRDRTIANSLMALDPRNAETLILSGTDRVNGVNELARFWNQRGEFKRGVDVLHKALQDSAIADKADELWLMTAAFNRLGTSDPKRVAVLLADLAPTTKTESNRTRLARLFSDLMLAFDANPPERYPQMREALLLLLPQVRKLSEANTSIPGRKFMVGTQVVEVRNGQERLLIRFGAFLHALAPDVYAQSKDLFGQWDSALASVKTVKEAASLPGSPGNILPPRVPTPAAPPPFGDVLAHLEKVPPSEANARAFARLITRDDVPVGQRATLIPAALEAARASGVVSDLLDAVDSVAWTDPSVIKPVLVEYLSELQKKDGSPGAYQWIAREERALKFTLDSDDPALAAVRTIIDLEETVLPGYDFTVTDLEGKTHRLSEQRGKVVLLNFWATWCPPCRAEMPLFNKVQREWASKGLVIFNITDEDADTVASFMKQFHYDLPAMLDGTRKVFDRYDVLGIPRTYVLDRSGQIFATLPEAFAEIELIRVMRAAGLK